MPDLTQQQLFFLYLSGTSDASGDVILHTTGLKPGGVLTFDIVSTRVASGTTGVVAIEFHLGEQVMGLKTLAMGTAGYWYKTRGPVRIPSNWCIRLTFSGAGNVKQCDASVYGYVEYPE